MLENLEKYKIILASNSPRRKELLSGLGIKYEVKTLPGIEETYPDTLKAEAPRSAESSPVIREKRVLFPDPFGPTTPTRSPFSTRKLAALKMSRAP